MPTKLEFLPADPTLPAAMLRDYRRTLVAPMDDMWASFAEQAHSFTMRRGGEPIGFFTVNDERELHRFHVQRQHEFQADALFRQVLAERRIRAAFASTVDPAFTSLTMDLAQGIDVRALLFEHAVAPASATRSLTRMRLAEPADHEAAVAFELAGTGGPEAFLQPYLTKRITASELLLHEIDGAIVGVGELRRDRVHAGYAHLGVVVGEAQRGQGMGSAIMAYLVDEARRRELKPRCSTEPTNLAARRVIERAGFRARHRVLRVTFESPSQE